MFPKRPIVCYSLYMVDIVQKDTPILRTVAKDVPVNEIGSEKINKIISDMIVAMDSQKDGIAIAAPQIGVPLRIFIVKGKLLRHADHTYKGGDEDLIFINPKITKLSKEKKEVEEGCLSVRWLYGKVKRSVRASIIALNEKGEKIERGASGVLAQIFQHETDHLNGTLFIDKAKELWEMTEEEINEINSK